ncbi:Multidrug resistance protein stp [Nocardioides dokdonensis FR1436]|uniref:Multidrug resistance protein stp n=1 Tax=Nocardioides dokdonensis FR1436 TaxID=1300347 RepID=A0A1A9GKE4_9ACTN|nr:MFS transporter [Nocardioides dokdonensis]ANH38758.1 Multidrug resistance protein stp [Nocardioides dokdonensis FR1436]
MLRSTTPRARGGERVTFAVLAVAVSSFVMLQSLIIPVLAQVQVQYETDQATVTWVLTGYLLSASIATPLIGRLGDAIGKRRMLVITLAVLTLGSALAALAPTIGWLIVARAVQGVGGGVLPLAFGIIRDEFSDTRVNGALSVMASLTAVGFGVGIVVAGPVVDSLGYSWLFWLPMIATALAAVGALLLVPESPVRTPGRLPVLPALLLAGWLVCLLLGVSQGNVWGWTSARVPALLVAAVVLLVAWVVVETRVPVPLIDMTMMRQRGIWTANAVAAFVGFGMFASFGFLPQFLQTPTATGYGFGASISESAQLLLPSAVASFAVGFVTARLVRRMGARTVIVAGTLGNTVAFCSVALFHDHTWQLYLATTVQGLSSGFVFSSLAGVVIASVPAHQTGVASGMNANIRTIGGAIGSAVMAGILTADVLASGYPTERAYTLGFLVLGGAMVLAALAASRIPDLHEQGTAGSWADADNAELGYLPSAPAR